ncbi:MAG: tetratricopeptide repeat protein [Candidatus Latescibacterota bacterium]
MLRLVREDHRFLLWLSLGALVLRVIYVLESQANPFFSAPVVDAQAFLDQARQIAQGNWIGGAEPFWQPPLYPYFLALLCALTPEQFLFLAIRLVQAVMGTASCVLVYLLARRAADRRVGRAAALLMAAYGPLIYYDGELLAVPLEILLNLLLLVLLTMATEDDRPGQWIASGAVAGLAAITRPNVLLFLVLYALWQAGVRRAKPGALRGRTLLNRALLLGLPLALIIGAVTVRNYLVGGDLVAISSNGGVNFYLGNNAQYDSTVAIHPGHHWENLVGEPLQAGCTTPSQCSGYFYRKAFAFIGSAPGEYAALLLKKTWLFWSGPEIKRNQSMYYAREHSRLLSLLLWDRVVSFPFGLVGPLSLLGLGLTRGMGTPRASILRLYALGYTASVVLFFVTARYRAPVVPVLLIFAAWALSALVQRVRDRSYRYPATAVAVLLVLLVGLNQGSAARPEDDAQLYHDLGEVHLRKADYPRAIEFLSRALQLESDYPSAHHNLAVAYLEQQRYDQAILHAREALRSQPMNLDTRSVLAQALAGSGQPREARAELQQVLRRNPSLQPAGYHYGRLLLRQGQPAEALPYLLAASQWQSGSYWIQYELGQAFQGTGQLDRALEQFRRAEVLDPSRPEAANAAGAMLLLGGQPQQARACFDRALQRDPGNPEALTNLGFLSLKEGRFRQAIELLGRALHRTTNPAPVYRGLAQAYRATGQKERARELEDRLQILVPAP